MDGTLLAIISIVLIVALTAVGLMIRSTMLRLRREISELKSKTQKLTQRIDQTEQRMAQTPISPMSLLPALPALLTPMLAKRLKGTKWGIVASAGMFAYRLISSYMQRRATTRRGH